MQNFYKQVEDAIQTLGVNPEDTRCSNPGEWLLQKDFFEIYVDVWMPKNTNQWQAFAGDKSSPIFQVIVPFCQIPTMHIEQFNQELLYLNFHLYNASFMLNKEQNTVAIHSKTIAKELTTEKIAEKINSCGFYAESLFGYFEERYLVKKIETEQPNS
ncbi:MAG: hypothetical protein CNE98_04245 [Bacteroidetes bacterium MED-G17]|nr:MAG: hypothetical protein CNE98_04245 [Bacteroidetes bacterium MED-G17]|tara:strand:+ start:196 stop:666 length:471 start_codon:yes stop_codon:yes gene_type:complete